ncbi:hypothetical protein SASPL_123045 [Salvia splendens]|uniref:Protein kinase domain-containing protein n=1 Tax=Salvia splendens TaxID=180675 RepID=A0A8X8XN94_SALSN|nr:hypothetical protein SASPL_123042 [Salvia splendens]KAG6415632.1 hypothetical protein SASPL_123045 [Salvia splendens]
MHRCSKSWMFETTVPLALKRLVDGFQYDNNRGLCGSGFSSLRGCVSLAVGVVVVSVIVSAVGILSFALCRRHKQKLGSAFEMSKSRLSTDRVKEGYRKNGSPLVSLEYSNGWDPLAEDRRFGGLQEVMQSFKLNLQEVETATQYFADKNLCRAYRGPLRDGSIMNSSCKSEEAEFLKGLNIITSLRHENLVMLRGFCCSRGRGECFLVYDYIPNGSLFRYLYLKEGDDHVLEWSTRVSIINGIAKGTLLATVVVHSIAMQIKNLRFFFYLNRRRVFARCKVNKPCMVHQNILGKNVLINQWSKPLLSDSCLHKLLTDDTFFSALKASAAMGYLAPEYTNTVRFTEKSVVYAFRVLLFQILSGKRKYVASMRASAESCSLDFKDTNLHGVFKESEATMLANIAAVCTHESPEERPSMEAVVRELCHY